MKKVARLRIMTDDVGAGEQIGVRTTGRIKVTMR